MTPELCPECKGKCCRDQDYRCRVLHMAAECYEHVCDYCWDGTKYVPQRTVAEERADLIAWLKAQGGRSAWVLVPEVELLHHVGYAKKSAKSGQ